MTDADDASPPPIPAVRHITTSELFQNAREIVIVHKGEHYRLRITQRGRLILTK